MDQPSEHCGVVDDGPLPDQVWRDFEEAWTNGAPAEPSAAIRHLAQASAAYLRLLVDEHQVDVEQALELTQAFIAQMYHSIVAHPEHKTI